MNDATLAPGRRLSQIRQEMGLSQRRVAELSGLTHSAISTIEQDKVSPALSTLQKLLKVYGMSLSAFFSDPVSRPPRVVIEASELIEMGSQGVSLRLIPNSRPQRTLGMLLETYAPGATIGEKLRHHGHETGTLLEGIFGYQETPSVSEVAMYFIYLIPALVLFFMPSRPSTQPSRTAH